MLCAATVGKLVGQSSTLAIDFDSELQQVTAILESEEILDSIASIAVKNSNLLGALGQNIQINEEEILQSKRMWMSTFRFGVGLFSINTQEDPNEQSNTAVGGFPTIGLNMSVNPEQFINRASTIRQSKYKKEYSEYIFRETRQEIKREIKNLYFDYLGMIETVKIREDALEDRRQQMSFIENQVKVGEATYDFLMLTSNQVRLSEEALITAMIEMRKKREEIKTFIGLK